MLDASRGSKAGFLGDVLLLSDREKPNKFNITQLNYLLGISFKSGSARLQFDREEDRPIDRKGLSYRYWDARLSFEFGSGGRQGQALKVLGAPAGKSWAKWLSGRGMVGWFLHNHSFPARSDLSGLAFLRYNAMADVDLGGGFFLRGEGDWLTEKHRGIHPVEMNTSAGLGVRYGGLEFIASQEDNKLLDRAGSNRFRLISVVFPFTGK